MPERGVRRLGRRDYAVDPASLARFLLGGLLVRVRADGERLAGRIVETEAYLGVRDRAAHTFGARRTPRTEPMFGAGGTAYVYRIYGMHWCFNVAAGQAGDPVAVLVRALEPTEGLATMRRLRGLAEPPPGLAARRLAGALARAERELCRGPGRLCAALEIDGSLSALDMTTDPRLFIEHARAWRVPDPRVGTSPRIGVDYAGPWAAAPLRFFVKDSSKVSGPRKQAMLPTRGLDELD